MYTNSKQLSIDHTIFAWSNQKGLDTIHVEKARGVYLYDENVLEHMQKVGSVRKYMGQRYIEEARYINGIPEGPVKLHIGIEDLDYNHYLYCNFTKGIPHGQAMLYESYKFSHDLYEFINGSNSDEADVLAIFLGYTSFDNLLHSTDSINQLNKEYW